MKPLKTLHVNTERTWRGGEQLTLYLINGLKKRGHITDVLAQPGSPMVQAARRDGHRVFECSMRGEVDIFAMGYLISLIRREKYQILHLHTPHSHTLGGVAGFFSGRPSRVVNKRTDFSIYRHSFLGLNKYKYNYLADGVIAESKKIWDVLVEDGVFKDRLYMVYEGIDARRFDGADGEHLRREFGIQPHQKVIGNIAHFADHKGQIYLIEAIPKVLEKHPEAVFFLVGEGELREPLMKRAEELGILKNTYFPGFRKDVPDFFKFFDIFLISSHMEGLCTSILDSFAVKTPVVATRAGGIPEIVQHGVTGLLAPPKDPDGLASTIIEALENPELLKETAQKGHELFCQSFTVDHMVENTLEVYRDLVRKRGQRGN